MKKITFLLCTIAVIALQSCGTKQSALTEKQPLRVTFFGDSYTTFEGCIPQGHEPWYFYDSSPGKNKDNDVNKPEQTWWHQTIAMLDTMAYRLGNYRGAILERNNSYSGSTIGYTGYIEDKESGVHADYKPRSFITRAPHLGNPHLILICGATNDSWDGEEIGEFKYSDWQEQDFYTFRPAMARFCHDMKKLYPKARMVFIVNCDLKPDFVASIHTICKRYDMECMDLHDIDKQAGHPSQKGMTEFARQVIDYLQKK